MHVLINRNHLLYFLYSCNMFVQSMIGSFVPQTVNQIPNITNSYSPTIICKSSLCSSSICLRIFKWSHEGKVKELLAKTGTNEMYGFFDNIICNQEKSTQQHSTIRCIVSFEDFLESRWYKKNLLTICRFQSFRKQYW